ncbi:MAG: AbrB/MazE/SpoVT family DNA-binding domain-containing protein [Symploca sp. SIO2G7]|nr:AbrB/MazE/SpoVT family DNA-binding domain-containing protein [Symploca sp. SIO2G7]
MITQKVSTWGNSLGIRLPQAITLQLGLQEGTLLTLTVKDNQIILAPAKPKYSLDELLQEANPEQQHNEFDWKDSTGDENW